jgi:PDZ domain-containing protein
MVSETPPGLPGASESRWSIGGGPVPRKVVAFVPLLVLAFVLYAVRLPYFVIGPGPAEDVEPLIHVSGTTTYQSRGHLILTSVTEQQANAFDLVGAWLDPASTVLSERDVLGPGVTPQQEEQIARSEMDTSKIDAAVVALEAYAHYPKEHRPGALVEFVVPNSPADGKLFAGDVVTAINGQRVQAVDDFGADIQTVGGGHQARLTVAGRPGGVVSVTVVPRWDPKLKRALVGIVAVANFPFDLTIDSGNIGGPSAGLMWTLGLIDLLTPGDLTGGRTIAGTGVIGPDGKVYAIGGVEEKVVAAQRRGAVVFFVPVDNAVGARSVAEGMAIVPVRTYADAVRYLRALP